MESKDNYAKKSHNDDPFGGMSKKRTSNMIAADVF